MSGAEAREEVEDWTPGGGFLAGQQTHLPAVGGMAVSVDAVKSLRDGGPRTAGAGGGPEDGGAAPAQLGQWASG